MKSRRWISLGWILNEAEPSPEENVVHTAWNVSENAITKEATGETETTENSPCCWGDDYYQANTTTTVATRKKKINK